MPVTAAAFALAAVTAVLLTVRCWVCRASGPAVVLTGRIAGSMVVWLTTELLLLLINSPAGAEALRMGALLASSGATTAFFVLTYFLLDRTWVPPRRFMALVCVEPAVMAAAALTDHWHHLLLITVRRSPDSLTWITDWGPLYWWGHFPYVQVLTVIALWRLARLWLFSGDRYRSGYIWIAVAVLPPVLANLVWVSGVYRAVNLTPIMLTLTLGAVFRLVSSRVLDHGPIAHRRIFNAVNDAVVVVDRAGIVLDANPAAERLAARIRPERDFTLVGRWIGAELTELTRTDRSEIEHMYEQVWGTDLDLHIRACRLWDNRRRPLGWTFVGRDVTEFNRRQDELRLANERLRTQLRTIEALRADLAEQAIRDPLTELFNRRYLMERLAEATEEGVTPGLSVAVIDIDHFKRVNDTFGHVCGDRVLVGVARLLAAGVRGTDVLARHGGEEFVLLMPDTTAPRAWERVDALRRRVAAAPVDIDGRSLTVTLSSGVATRRVGESAACLLQAADDALYQAKHRGRDRVVSAEHRRRVPDPSSPARSEHRAYGPSRN